MDGDVGDNRCPPGKGSLAMMANCRLNPADERSTSRAVTCCVLIWSKRSRLFAFYDKIRPGRPTAAHFSSWRLCRRQRSTTISIATSHLGDIGLQHRGGPQGTREHDTWGRGLGDAPILENYRSLSRNAGTTPKSTGTKYDRFPLIDNYCSAQQDDTFESTRGKLK